MTTTESEWHINLRGVGVQRVPQLSLYAVADVIGGTSFPHSNLGGATFNTYGSRFRLQVTNNGANPITLTQVLVFARVH
jgi:hypothetical protein